MTLASTLEASKRGNMPPQRPVRAVKDAESEPLRLVFTMNNGDVYRFTPLDVTRAMRVALSRDCGLSFGECITKTGQLVAMGAPPDPLWLAPLLWAAKVQDGKNPKSIAAIEDELVDVVDLGWENAPDDEAATPVEDEPAPEALGGN